MIKITSVQLTIINNKFVKISSPFIYQLLILTHLVQSYSKNQKNLRYLVLFFQEKIILDIYTIS
jgi:hypothetical protein